MPKSQKEINTNLLVAIYQNLQTAKQSINNVIEKIKDSKLKKELKKQFKDYDNFSESCEDLAKVYDIELVDNNFFKKAKMWININLSTMMDKSNRKIASLNIVGSTMGVIDLMSVLSDSKKAKKELQIFGKRILQLEESNIEKLKPYILVENNKPNSEVAEQAKETGALETNKKSQTKQSSKAKTEENKELNSGEI